ncbi:MAG: DNA gyrase subunit A [Candidatus Moraniibacteriota bacterium]|nr:MAG: DNA gyrase subunit A [Candidatus Moranbacteria bacterium]
MKEETEKSLFSENIKDKSIVDEIQQSYLDYAMSVIVSRALPDVRDGLKPVHRRILYSLWTSGLKSSAKFRKSATVVGDVLGKYHPHGDTAVYDSMVRMAQDFSLRYPLIWGQGNFGSMDGDSAAAYRYTEAKLQKIAEEMLFDIEKETVNFVPNFDGVHKEPSVLPSKLPQLLLNGSVGIAVGMATNIPPHNLGELVDALVYLVDNADAGVDDLMEFIKGPDFPTGGIIFGREDIREAYGTGRGKIAMRGKAEIVEVRDGVFHIIISEMTYATNKADFLQKIANLVHEGKMTGIKDLRDESDRDGVRVVVELKKDAYPKKVLNRLYAMTDLQKNFNVNMLALVDGIEPKVLNLKTVLEAHLKHREEVVLRRTKFDLQKAKDRAHILEGLKKALDHINKIIETIKKSPSKEEAHVNLVNSFQFSDKQASAILEMRLQTLAGLERKKIEDELEEKKILMKELQSILDSRETLMGIVKDEYREIKKTYGDARKTKVVSQGVGDINQEDLIPNQEVIIALSRDGYVKRMDPSTYRVQHRGGKGVIGAATKENDLIRRVLTVMMHDDLFFFTNFGKVFQLKAYELPESSRVSKGQSMVNFLQLSPSEYITEFVAFGKDHAYKYLVMATAQGVIKKTAILDLMKVRRSGLIAIRLDEKDTLGWVKPTFGNNEIVLTTAKGQAIRFFEEDVRSMGRTAAGVRGIRLHHGDEVVGMDVIQDLDKHPELLIITKEGYGKRSKFSQYKIQKRGGGGIRTANITPKTGNLVWASVVYKEDLEEDLIIITKKGQIIRIALKTIPLLGRSTQGVRIMRPKAGDELSAATTV